MDTVRVVVALDSFKGSVSAADACAAVAAGLRSGGAAAEVVELPVADGGEGTVAALAGAGFERQLVEASGPLGDQLSVAIGRQGTDAVVELASVAGLSLVRPSRATALAATTYGVGQLIGAAVDDGARRVIVGVGGSCTTDGGAGLVEALGGRLLDATGRPVLRGGGGLLDLAAVDLAVVRPGREVEVVAATDVTNPLTGPAGAAAVYGPQKGAGPGEVALLDRALGHWADLVAEATGRDARDAPGAGAAGGAAFGLSAVLGAPIVSGVDLILDLLGFDELVGPGVLVIVGEGSLDQQSLYGKGPVGIAARAADLGARVVAVAGRSLLAPAEIADARLEAVYTLTALEPDLATTMTAAVDLLRRTGAVLVERL